MTNKCYKITHSTNNKFFFSILIIISFFILLTDISAGKQSFPFFLDSTKSSNSELSKIDNYTLKGLYAIYSEDYGKALCYYDSAFSIDSWNLRANLYCSTVYLWRYLSKENEEDLDLFIELSRKTMGLCEDILDKNENNTDAYAVMAANYGYRAMIYAKSGSFLKAAWAGKHSYEYLQETYKRNPNQIEVFLGMGFSNYALGSMPKKFQSIISIIGMEGDKEKGLEQMNIAAVKGIFTKCEALFFLSQIYRFYEKDTEKYNFYLKQLFTEFPSSSLFKKLDEKEIFRLTKEE